jgi:hypothetical protein
MLASDSGMALAVVMLMSSILFLLATTVLLLVTYREKQTAAVTERDQSMHIADAGLNEYVYQLSQQYDYWKTHSTLGPTEMQGGEWMVTQSTSSSGTLVLTSVGTLPNGKSRTVRGTVRFPSYADYVVLVDKGPYSIGTGATFYGNVRCNGNISNSGIIAGLAEAGGTCSYGTSYAYNYPGGYKNNVSKVDFSQLTTDLQKMKTSAQAAGVYYPASGQLGYNVVLNGPQATIYKISAVNKKKPRTGVSTDPLLGAFTQTLVGTAVIPADGVLFFDDDVWVSGTYSAAVTVATSADLWCPGDLVPTNPSSTVTCGLVAGGQVLFPWWYGTMPDNQVVQAATLSQTAGVGPDAPSGLTQYNTSTGTWSSSYTMGSADYKSSVTLKGGRAMVQMIGFSAGYDTRNFEMDPRLIDNPPPLYPQIRDGSLRVDTWLEN